MSGHTHNVITARQIKAARALLDWSQEKLAEACNLSIATIRKIESGYISPRVSTMGGIQQALEGAGLEFIDPDGVRRRPEDIKVYHGSEGTIAFFDDVYQTANKGHEEIVVVCISEEPFALALGDYKDVHLARMRALANRVSVKCIITENYLYTPADYCEYRSISKAYVDSVPFYIYGDNYAIFLFDAQPSPKIIVHKSSLLAKAYRRQFHSMWEKATPLNQQDKKSSSNSKSQTKRKG